MRRHYVLTVTTLVVALALGGCGVDRDVIGSYEHPDAGVIIMGDDGNGGYVLFDGQTRVIEGDHQPPDPGVTLYGSTDSRPWDDTYLDWRSAGDVVTISPEGGPEVEGLMVDGGPGHHDRAG